MVHLSIVILEKRLVTSIAVVWSEYINKSVWATDLVGLANSRFGLPVVAAVLPVNPHHPLASLVIVYNLWTFKRSPTGYILAGICHGACRCHGQSEPLPVVQAA